MWDKNLKANGFVVWDGFLEKMLQTPSKSIKKIGCLSGLKKRFIKKLNRKCHKGPSILEFPSLRVPLIYLVFFPTFIYQSILYYVEVN